MQSQIAANLDIHEGEVIPAVVLYLSRVMTEADVFLRAVISLDDGGLMEVNLLPDLSRRWCSVCVGSEVLLRENTLDVPGVASVTYYVVVS